MVTPFLRAAMRRAEEDREARIVSTPAKELPRETGLVARCSRGRCSRPAVGDGLCLQHLGNASRGGRVRTPGRCECGQPATRFDSGHRPVCQSCHDTWTRYVNAESMAGRALKAVESGPVSAVAVAERLGLSENHAYAVLARLAKAGKVRRTGRTLPIEYEVVR